MSEIKVLNICINDASQVCVPHLYCSVHYADLVISPTSTPCWLAINTPGICCYPTVPNVGKVINIGIDC